MTRKKQTAQDRTPATPERALLDALRSNLSLLGELAVRYEVETQPERPADPPAINSPQDVHRLLGPEMSSLAQEQLQGAASQYQEQRRGAAGDLPGECE